MKNLLIEFPDAKFLIKKPTYGSSFDLDIIYPILGDNYDSIKWFDNIEEDFYQNCKFVLYPSLNEGYGLVPVEAIMDGAIPILNYTQSNYWVHHNNVYYINNELNNNPDLYNFDYYLKNYDLINEQWVVELKDILNKDTRHHIQFVTDTQKKVLDYHQNRYKKLYSKFKKILERSNVMNILVGTNRFYPLYGGGEKALIDWLIDFTELGHKSNSYYHYA